MISSVRKIYKIITQYVYDLRELDEKNEKNRSCAGDNWWQIITVAIETQISYYKIHLHGKTFLTCLISLLYIRMINWAVFFKKSKKPYASAQTVTFFSSHFSPEK